MTTWLERIDLDQVTQQAREVHFWRTVLTLIAGLLFGLGWVTAKAFALVWLALAWMFVAVRAGWRDGRGITSPTGPSVPPR